jgi:hypothetical protein
MRCTSAQRWLRHIGEGTTNRGGYLDYLVDEHWWKADSKGMRALRAFAIQISLARVASVSAKNDSDRQLLAIRIGAITKRFMPIYACAFNTNPLGVKGAEKDPCFYYDSAMVEYSTGLFDLAMIALPIEDAKNLVNSVAGSVINPINLADVLNSLLKIGKDALKYGRIVGALYRDTVELEVQLWLATPAIDDRPPSARVTEAHVAALREIYDRRNDDLSAWISAIAALRSQGLEPLPHPKFFEELGGLMRYLCDLITKDPDASNACKSGLPTTLPAPTPVLASASPVRISAVVTTNGAGGPTVKVAALRTNTGGSAGTQIGDDPERKALKDFLRVGTNSFDPDKAAQLQEIVAMDAIRLQVQKIQTGRVPLALIVDERRFAAVRKLIVDEAHKQGFIQ